MAELTYEIIEHFGVISENDRGWKKELNLVSWNNHPAKYDIRDWNDDRTKMSKGITLTHEEVIVLQQLITQLK